jgi:hypothetical protein
MQQCRQFHLGWKHSTLAALDPAIHGGGFIAVGEPYWRTWPLPERAEPEEGEDDRRASTALMPSPSTRIALRSTLELPQGLRAAVPSGDGPASVIRPRMSNRPCCPKAQGGRRSFPSSLDLYGPRKSITFADVGACSHLGVGGRLAVPGGCELARGSREGSWWNPVRA